MQKPSQHKHRWWSPFQTYLVSKAEEGIKLIVQSKSTWGIQIPLSALQQQLSTLKETTMQEVDFLILLFGLLQRTPFRAVPGLQADETATTFSSASLDFPIMKYQACQ